MVSARRPRVDGTDELKLADWYMSDSLDDTHCIFPPRVSKDSSISSDVLELVDLKARRSIIWLTPRSSSFSYRDPASTYTPIPEK